MARTTNPNDFIDLIQVFRIAFINGIINKEELIKWADEIINKDEEPAELIIELSLTKNKSINDILVLLNNFLKNYRSSISIRVILGLLHQNIIQNKISLKKAVSILNTFCWNEDISELEASFVYYLDEDYDLAVKGIYGSMERVKKDTIRFLEIYDEFKIENYNHWAEINSQINNKLILLSEKIKKEDEIIFNKRRKNQEKSWWKFW